jgi:hypothetical protein
MDVWVTRENAMPVTTDDQSQPLVSSKPSSNGVAHSPGPGVAHSPGPLVSAVEPAHNPEQVKSAIERCDRMLAWYEKHLARARVLYRVFSTATVVLAATSPILILWQSGVPTIMQAAPAALASLFATLVGSYRWREDWIRYAVAAETLRSERTKFTTRTTQDYGLQLSASAAFDNFVYRMESLAISEVSEWRNQLAQKTNEPAKDERTVAA